jgi:hypothetical protein
MHYANGRTAKVGDIVKGKGYNIKHEITGLLTSANPASIGNCTVATVSSSSLVKGFTHREGGTFVLNYSTDREGHRQLLPPEVVATIEYGQCDAFLALDPKTGEVLPPE